jgi:diaminopimelate decarboxylase
VGKTVLELAAALDAGIRCFNVESEGELRALAQLAAASGRVAPPIGTIDGATHRTLPLA